MPKVGKSEVWKDVCSVAKKIKVMAEFVACKHCYKAFKFAMHITGTTHLSLHVQKRENKPSTSFQKQLKLPFKKKCA